MESILGGWQAINEGRAKIVVAGGTESMSNIPLMFNRQAAAHLVSPGKVQNDDAAVANTRFVSTATFQAGDRDRARFDRPGFGIEHG